MSLWLGDYEFITFRMRLVHFMTDICCTMSLSMGLVDSRASDFWISDLGLRALFVYQIVLGIALRVSAVGASERAMHAPGKPATRRVERNYFIMCFSFSAVSMLCAVSYVHVMDGGGCGDGFQISGLHVRLRAVRVLRLVRPAPSAITFRWVLGRALLRLSTDADTEDDGVLLEKVAVLLLLWVRAAAVREGGPLGIRREGAQRERESSEPGSVLSADVENGGASPTPSYRSRHTSERLGARVEEEQGPDVDRRG